MELLAFLFILSFLRMNHIDSIRTSRALQQWPQDRIFLDKFLGVVSVRSRLQCVVLCLNTADCVTLTFTKSTSKPREGLCRVHSSGVSLSSTDADTRVYQMIRFHDCNSAHCLNGGSCVDKIDGYKCNCPTEYSGPHCETGVWLEMSCNGTCKPSRTGCFSGRCLCSDGYYFSQSQYACVANCSNFSDVKYLQYSGYDMAGHDEFSLGDVNPEICMSRCTGDPQCRTLVYSVPSRACYFKYITAQDYPSDWKQLSDFNTYQRTCL